MPGDVKNLREPVEQELADSLLERRWIDAGANGLAGKQIQFTGLQLTITDVLVRIETLTAEHGQPSPILPSRGFRLLLSQTWLGVADAYLRLGIEHIWAELTICCLSLR